MTKFTSRSADLAAPGAGAAIAPGHYESAVWRESRRRPGVRYEVLRMSLLRRHRLLLELKGLAAKQRFQAAREGVENEIAAAELRGRIDEKTIRAALVRIEGLSIGGAPATVESLLESGPEDLAYEIAEAIADESFLNEEERKN
jgi:hypothetical protein